MRAGRERRSQSQQQRFPKRGTDWAEDAAAWVLASLALIAAVTSLFIGMRVNGDLMDRAEHEAHTRSSVRAVLTEDATPRMPARIEPDAPLTAKAPVRWFDGGGNLQITLADVPSTDHAGDTILVWVDRDNHLVPPPTSPYDAVAAGYVSGAVLLFVSIAILIALWFGIRNLTWRRNERRWARDWAVVEPRWSGRAVF